MPLTTLLRFDPLPTARQGPALLAARAALQAALQAASQATVAAGSTAAGSAAAGSTAGEAAVGAAAAAGPGSAAGTAALIAAVDRQLQRVEAVAALEVEAEARRRPTTGWEEAAAEGKERAAARRLLALDGASDAAVSGLFHHWRAAQDEGGPAGAAAGRLIDALFPAGLAAHIGAPPEHQSAHNVALVRALVSRAFAADLAATTSGSAIAQVFSTAEALADGVQVERARRAALTADADRLRSARAALHAALCELLVQLLAHTAGDPAARRRLVGPLWPAVVEGA